MHECCQYVSWNVDFCRLCRTHFISIYADFVSHFMSTFVVDVTCFFMSTMFFNYIDQLMIYSMVFFNCESIFDTPLCKNITMYLMLQEVKVISLKEQKMRWSSFQFLHNVFFSIMIVFLWQDVVGSLRSIQWEVDEMKSVLQPLQNKLVFCLEAKSSLILQA